MTIRRSTYRNDTRRARDPKFFAFWGFLVALLAFFLVLNFISTSNYSDILNVVNPHFPPAALSLSEVALGALGIDEWAAATLTNELEALVESASSSSYCRGDGESDSGDDGGVDDGVCGTRSLPLRFRTEDKAGVHSNYILQELLIRLLNLLQHNDDKSHDHKGMLPSIHL